ncbi:MAG TPA: hypothetical protein VHJ17_01950 [Thermomonospora sp.]|nr:hypothetical protein [Thermomonospora sp.]
MGAAPRPDHVATIAASLAEDLVGAASRTLLDLPPQRHRPLLETLPDSLQSGDNAVVTAERRGVHPGTVRYRLPRTGRPFPPRPTPGVLHHRTSGLRSCSHSR